MVASPARIRATVTTLLAGDSGRSRPVPVARLAREQGIQVIARAFEGDEDVSGFYLRDGSERVIGVNEAHAEVRRRFTIAHELGHALLQDENGLHIDTAFVYKFRDQTSSQAVDPDEIAANRFAAELLMPEKDVRDLVPNGIDLSDDGAVREMARYFGVSAQAMLFRLMNLGIAGIDRLDGQARFG